MASAESISINLLLEESARKPPDVSRAAGIHPGGPPGGSSGDSHDGPKGQIPIGYSKAVLKGPAQPKILCVQCERVLRDPVQSQCGHRYCRQCYTSLVQSQPGVKCAACVKEGEGEEDCASLTLGGIFPDHAIRKDMSTMEAKCENPGCGWIGTFGNFVKHETECQFKKKKCDCDIMVYGNKMEEHKKNECRLRIVNCLYCNVSLVAKNQAEHDMSCEFYPQICSECGSKMPRSKMAEHVDPFKGDCKNRKCPFGCDAVSTPSHQEEKLIDHLSMVLSKVMTLKTNMEQGGASADAMNNDALTAKVDELEGKVAGLARHFQSLERAGGTTEFSRQGEAAARPAESTSLAALTEKQSTVESLVAVLNRQLEKIIVEYNGLEHQRRLQTESADTLQRKVTSLERSVALKDIALAEQDLRIQALEQTSFDGVLVWPITDFSRKRQEAVGGRTLSIYSPPFYTSRCGYKMCCRLYLNGDGMGKATHISLFFVVMKGQYDAILPWPFRQKVTLMLLDQGNKDHLIDAFRPDPTSTSFRRPVSDMNIASGCPLFCPLSKLEDRKPAYVKDDSIFIKVIVDQSGI